MIMKIQMQLRPPTEYELMQFETLTFRDKYEILCDLIMIFRSEPLRTRLTCWRQCPSTINKEKFRAGFSNFRRLLSRDDRRQIHQFLVQATEQWFSYNPPGLLEHRFPVLPSTARQKSFLELWHGFFISSRMTISPSQFRRLLRALSPEGSNMLLYTMRRLVCCAGFTQGTQS